jgi:hypothetical protein
MAVYKPNRKGETSKYYICEFVYQGGRLAHATEGGEDSQRERAPTGLRRREYHIRIAAKRDAVAGVVLRPKAKESENSEAVPVNVPVVEQAATIQ